MQNNKNRWRLWSDDRRQLPIRGQVDKHTGSLVEHTDQLCYRRVVGMQHSCNLLLYYQTVTVILSSNKFNVLTAVVVCDVRWHDPSIWDILHIWINRSNWYRVATTTICALLSKRAVSTVGRRRRRCNAIKFNDFQRASVRRRSPWPTSTRRCIVIKRGCPAARLVMDLLDRFGFATNINEFYKLIKVNLRTAAETEAAL